MSQQNVNTTASESKESSSFTAKPSEGINYDAIRRAFRRNLFYFGYRRSHGVYQRRLRHHPVLTRANG